MAEIDPSPMLRTERRLALRVPVRRRVRAAIGLRAFEALLLDLSVTGCRIRCGQPVAAHGSVWVVLPAGFGGRLPLPLRGEVLAAPAAEAQERRGAPRRWFARRVIARGAGRPRVLVGRDLSAGGMCVENAAGLAAGDALQLALHSRAGDVPLVVSARVLRTGTNGEAALAFVDVSASQRVALEKLLLDAGDGAALVSEVLEPSPRLAD